MENRQLTRQMRNNGSPSLALPRPGGGVGWGFGFALSVVSFSFLIGAASGAGPRAVVSLRADSVVRGTEIRLGDVAEIQAHDPALAERLRGIEVGRAPLPGYSRTLDLSYLKARLRLQQVDPMALAFDVPPVISVTTASQRVTGSDLVAAVRQHILVVREADAEHLSIKSTSEPPDLVLPVGVLQLKVRTQPGVVLLGSVSATVEAWIDGVLVRTVSLPVRVSALTEILVAARPIGRHALLGTEDVRIERREVVPGQDALREVAAALGRRALRTISPGEAILAGMVELPPLVRRGDIVLLTAEGHGLRAVAQGEAREEGKAGQVIRVRNLTSGRDVYGQVDGERTVRVPF